MRTRETVTTMPPITCPISMSPKRKLRPPRYRFNSLHSYDCSRWPLGWLVKNPFHCALSIISWMMIVILFLYSRRCVSLSIISNDRKFEVFTLKRVNHQYDPDNEQCEWQQKGKTCK